MSDLQSAINHLLAAKRILQERLGDEVLGRGEGPSKQAAERNAATVALAGLTRRGTQRPAR